MLKARVSEPSEISYQYIGDNILTRLHTQQQQKKPHCQQLNLHTKKQMDFDMLLDM